MSDFLRISTKIKSVIEYVLGRLSSITMIVMVLFALAEIIRRYIFGVVFEWGQDAVIYAMVFSVSLFICVTQINRNHLVMSAFLQLLDAKGFYRIVGASKIFVSVIIFIFCFSISVTGWSTVEYSYEMEEKTQSLWIPLWPFHFALLVGFSLMALVAFLQTIEDIISYKKGEHFTSRVEVATDV